MEAQSGRPHSAYSRLDVELNRAMQRHVREIKNRSIPRNLTIDEETALKEQTERHRPTPPQRSIQSTFEYRTLLTETLQPSSLGQHRRPYSALPFHSVPKHSSTSTACSEPESLSTTSWLPEHDRQTLQGQDILTITNPTSHAPYPSWQKPTSTILPRRPATAQYSGLRRPGPLRPQSLQPSGTTTSASTATNPSEPSLGHQYQHLQQQQQERMSKESAPIPELQPYLASLIQSCKQGSISQLLLCIRTALDKQSALVSEASTSPSAIQARLNHGNFQSNGKSRPLSANPSLASQQSKLSSTLPSSFSSFPPSSSSSLSSSSCSSPSTTTSSSSLSPLASLPPRPVDRIPNIPSFPLHDLSLLTSTILSGQPLTSSNQTPSSPTLLSSSLPSALTSLPDLSYKFSTHERMIPPTARLLLSLLLNERDVQGRTPLHHCIYEDARAIDCARLLLHLGARPDGRGSLTTASTGTSNLFTQRPSGPSINNPDKMYHARPLFSTSSSSSSHLPSTPLQIAGEKGLTELIELLVWHGADINAVDLIAVDKASEGLNINLSGNKATSTSGGESRGNKRYDTTTVGGSAALKAEADWNRRKRLFIASEEALMEEAEDYNTFVQTIHLLKATAKLGGNNKRNNSANHEAALEERNVPEEEYYLSPGNFGLDLDHITEMTKKHHLDERVVDELLGVSHRKETGDEEGVNKATNMMAQNHEIDEGTAGGLHSSMSASPTSPPSPSLALPRGGPTTTLPFDDSLANQRTGVSQGVPLRIHTVQVPESGVVRTHVYYTSLQEAISSPIVSNVAELDAGDDEVQQKIKALRMSGGNQPSSQSPSWLQQTQQQQYPPASTSLRTIMACVRRRRLRSLVIPHIYRTTVDAVRQVSHLVNTVENFIYNRDIGSNDGSDESNKHGTQSFGVDADDNDAVNNSSLNKEEGMVPQLTGSRLGIDRIQTSVMRSLRCLCPLMSFFPRFTLDTPSAHPAPFGLLLTPPCAQRTSKESSSKPSSHSSASNGKNSSRHSHPSLSSSSSLSSSTTSLNPMLSLSSALVSSASTASVTSPFSSLPALIPRILPYLSHLHSPFVFWRRVIPYNTPRSQLPSNSLDPSSSKIVQVRPVKLPSALLHTALLTLASYLPSLPISLTFALLRFLTSAASQRDNAYSILTATFVDESISRLITTLDLRSKPSADSPPSRSSASLPSQLDTRLTSTPVSDMVGSSIPLGGITQPTNIGEGNPVSTFVPATALTRRRQSLVERNSVVSLFATRGKQDQINPPPSGAISESPVPAATTLDPTASGTTARGKKKRVESEYTNVPHFQLPLSVKERRNLIFVLCDTVLSLIRDASSKELRGNNANYGMGDRERERVTINTNTGMKLNAKEEIAMRIGAMVLDLVGAAVNTLKAEDIALKEEDNDRMHASAETEDRKIGAVQPSHNLEQSGKGRGSACEPTVNEIAVKALMTQPSFFDTRCINEQVPLNALSAAASALSSVSSTTPQPQLKPYASQTASTLSLPSSTSSPSSSSPTPSLLNDVLSRLPITRLGYRTTVSPLLLLGAVCAKYSLRRLMSLRVLPGGSLSTTSDPTSSLSSSSSPAPQSAASHLLSLHNSASLAASLAVSTLFLATNLSAFDPSLIVRIKYPLKLSVVTTQLTQTLMLSQRIIAREEGNILSLLRFAITTLQKPLPPPSPSSVMHLSSPCNVYQPGERASLALSRLAKLLRQINRAASFNSSQLTASTRALVAMADNHSPSPYPHDSTYSPLVISTLTSLRTLAIQTRQRLASILPSFLLKRLGRKRRANARDVVLIAASSIRGVDEKPSKLPPIQFSSKSLPQDSEGGSRTTTLNDGPASIGRTSFPSGDTEDGESGLAGSVRIAGLRLKVRRVSVTHSINMLQQQQVSASLAGDITDGDSSEEMDGEKSSQDPQSLSQPKLKSMDNAQSLNHARAPSPERYISDKNASPSQRLRVAPYSNTPVRSSPTVDTRGEAPSRAFIAVSRVKESSGKTGRIHEQAIKRRLGVGHADEGEPSESARHTRRRHGSITNAGDLTRLANRTRLSDEEIILFLSDDDMSDTTDGDDLTDEGQDGEEASVNADTQAGEAAKYGNSGSTEPNSVGGPMTTSPSLHPDEDLQGTTGPLSDTNLDRPPLPPAITKRSSFIGSTGLEHPSNMPLLASHRSSLSRPYLMPRTSIFEASSPNHDLSVSQDPSRGSMSRIHSLMSAVFSQRSSTSSSLRSFTPSSFCEPGSEHRSDAQCGPTNSEDSFTRQGTYSYSSQYGSIVASVDSTSNETIVQTLVSLPNEQLAQEGTMDSNAISTTSFINFDMPPSLPVINQKNTMESGTNSPSPSVPVAARGKKQRVQRAWKLGDDERLIVRVIEKRLLKKGVAQLKAIKSIENDLFGGEGASSGFTGHASTNPEVNEGDYELSAANSVRASMDSLQADTTVRSTGHWVLHLTGECNGINCHLSSTPIPDSTSSSAHPRQHTIKPSSSDSLLSSLNADSADNQATSSTKRTNECRGNTVGSGSEDDDDLDDNSGEEEEPLASTRCWLRNKALKMTSSPSSPSPWPTSSPHVPPTPHPYVDLDYSDLVPSCTTSSSTSLSFHALVVILSRITGLTSLRETSSFIAELAESATLSLFLHLHRSLLDLHQKRHTLLSLAQCIYHGTALMTNVLVNSYTAHERETERKRTVAIMRKQVTEASWERAMMLKAKQLSLSVDEAKEILGDKWKRSSSASSLGSTSSSDQRHGSGINDVRDAGIKALIGDGDSLVELQQRPAECGRVWTMLIDEGYVAIVADIVDQTVKHLCISDRLYSHPLSTPLPQQTDPLSSSQSNNQATPVGPTGHTLPPHAVITSAHLQTGALLTSLSSGLRERSLLLLQTAAYPSYLHTPTSLDPISSGHTLVTSLLGLSLFSHYPGVPSLMYRLNHKIRIPKPLSLRPQPTSSPTSATYRHFYGKAPIHLLSILSTLPIALPLTTPVVFSAPLPRPIRPLDRPIPTPGVMLLRPELPPTNHSPPDHNTGHQSPLAPVDLYTSSYPPIPLDTILATAFRCSAAATQHTNEGSSSSAEPISADQACLALRATSLVGPPTRSMSAITTPSHLEDLSSCVVSMCFSLLNLFMSSSDWNAQLLSVDRDDNAVDNDSTGDTGGAMNERDVDALDESDSEAEVCASGLNSRNDRHGYKLMRKVRQSSRQYDNERHNGKSGHIAGMQQKHEQNEANGNVGTIEDNNDREGEDEEDDNWDDGLDYFLSSSDEEEDPTLLDKDKATTTRVRAGERGGSPHTTHGNSGSSEGDGTNQNSMRTSNNDTRLRTQSPTSARSSEPVIDSPKTKSTRSSVDKEARVRRKRDISKRLQRLRQRDVDREDRLAALRKLRWATAMLAASSPSSDVDQSEVLTESQFYRMLRSLRLMNRVSLRRVLCGLIMRWGRCAITSQFIHDASVALHPLIQGKPVGLQTDLQASSSPSPPPSSSSSSSTTTRPSRNVMAHELKVPDNELGASLTEQAALEILSAPKKGRASLLYTHIVATAANTILEENVKADAIRHSHAPSPHGSSSIDTKGNELVSSRDCLEWLPNSIGPSTELLRMVRSEQAKIEGVLLATLLVAGPHATDRGPQRLSGDSLVGSGVFDMCIGLMRHSNDRIGAMAMSVVGHVTTPRKTRLSINVVTTVRKLLSRPPPTISISSDFVANKGGHESSSSMSREMVTSSQLTGKARLSTHVKPSQEALRNEDLSKGETKDIDSDDPTTSPSAGHFASTSTMATSCNVIYVFIDPDLEAELANEISIDITSSSRSSPSSTPSPPNTDRDASKTKMDNNRGDQGRDKSDKGGVLSTSAKPQPNVNDLLLKSVLPQSALPPSYLSRLLTHLKRERRGPSFARHWCDVQLYGLETITMALHKQTSTINAFDLGISLSAMVPRPLILTSPTSSSPSPSVSLSSGHPSLKQRARQVLSALTSSSKVPNYGIGIGFEWNTLSNIIRDCSEYLSLPFLQRNDSVDHEGDETYRQSYYSAADRVPVTRNTHTQSNIQAEYIDRLLSAASLSQAIKEETIRERYTHRDARMIWAMRILFHLCHHPEAYRAIESVADWKKNFVDTVLQRYQAHKEQCKRDRMALRLDATLKQVQQHIYKTMLQPEGLPEHVVSLSSTDLGSSPEASSQSMLSDPTQVEGSFTVSTTTSTSSSSTWTSSMNDSGGVAVTTQRLISFDVPDDDHLTGTHNAHASHGAIRTKLSDLSRPSYSLDGTKSRIQDPSYFSRLLAHGSIPPSSASHNANQQREHSDADADAGETGFGLNDDSSSFVSMSVRADALLPSLGQSATSHRPQQQALDRTSNYADDHRVVQLDDYLKGLPPSASHPKKSNQIGEKSRLVGTLAATRPYTATRVRIPIISSKARPRPSSAMSMNHSSSVTANSPHSNPSDQPGEAKEEKVGMTIMKARNVAYTVTKTHVNNTSITTTTLRTPIYSIVPPPIPIVDANPMLGMLTSAFPPRARVLRDNRASRLGYNESVTKHAEDALGGLPLRPLRNVTTRRRVPNPSPDTPSSSGAINTMTRSERVPQGVHEDEDDLASIEREAISGDIKGSGKENRKVKGPTSVRESLQYYVAGGKMSRDEPLSWRQ